MADSLEAVGSRLRAALDSCDLVLLSGGTSTSVCVNYESRSPTSVAAAVTHGRADWGVAIETVARQAGLGFLPLQPEQFDFMIPIARRQRPAAAGPQMLRPAIF